MANTVNLTCGEGNEVKSKISFLHSTPSSPHLPEFRSPADHTLSSFFPSFLDFPMYIPTSSRTTLLLTHPQEGFKLRFSQHSTSCVRKALFVFVWLEPSVSCCCLLTIVISSVTSLCEQGSRSLPHTPCSTLSTQPFAQCPAQRRYLINVG